MSVQIAKREPSLDEFGRKRLGQSAAGAARSDVKAEIFEGEFLVVKIDQKSTNVRGVGK
jgi:hypothetical protein